MIFGVPYWKYKIDPKQFSADILKDIEYNYSRDKSRNNWDKNSYVNSDLHHSNRDRGNTKFREINYKSVVPIYTNIFSRFVKELELTGTFDYTFQITNYTAMTSGQYMRSHNHIGDSDFTCIHYLKFNKAKHQATVFHNSHHWARDYQYLRPELYKRLDIRNPKHSYLLQYFQIPTEQGDFIITPSSVVHEVPTFNSDELRVTLVVNLQIK